MCSSVILFTHGEPTSPSPLAPPLSPPWCLLLHREIEDIRWQCPQVPVTKLQSYLHLNPSSPLLFPERWKKSQLYHLLALWHGAIEAIAWDSVKNWSSFKNRDNDNTNLIGLLWTLNEIMGIKGPALFLWRETFCNRECNHFCLRLPRCFEF